MEVTLPFVIPRSRGICSAPRLPHYGLGSHTDSFERMKTPLRESILTGGSCATPSEKIRAHRITCAPGSSFGFPAELVGVGELHAAFLNESRTRSRGMRHVQEIRGRSTGKCYCVGGLLVPWGRAAAGAGWVCCTPIALPETTRFTRRFCALPAAVELSATGLLMP